MNYTHLTREERYQIYALKRAGHRQQEIAIVLNRHPSTICRELKRNQGQKGYRPKQANELANQRRANNARRIDDAVWHQAQEQLKEQWSPEQISSQLAISHETLYQRIYADKKQGGTLWRNLRCQKKKRKRYASGHQRRGQIIGRRPIAQRPATVNARTRIGHWEGDTVIGAGHQHAIVTLVERKSGYAVIAKVQRKTADQVSSAIIEQLQPIAEKVHTLTYDNGKEFAEHARIDQILNSTTYFADPFASWQRGTNENFDGLLRQYIPKNRHLSTVTHEEITMIQNRLNHRPRKRLGWKTPHEVFHRSVKSVALRT